MPGQRMIRWALLAQVLVLLAACGSTPQRPTTSDQRRPPPAGDTRRDGPPVNPPADLAQTPDAEPRVEPIRAGGPNKPYEVLGERYTPVTEDKPISQTGLASWYGQKFHGRPTASGELYSVYGMTAAHRTLPIPSYARVRNPKNGKEVIVRVNDRGPFHKQRVIDLSYAAAAKLDLLRGVGTVEVERITHEAIRTGAWRHDDNPAAAPMALASTAPNTPAVLPTALASDPRADTRADTQADTQRVQRDPLRTTSGRGWWVQLAAFEDRNGALAMHRAVAQSNDWLAPLLALFVEGGRHKLQAGPYERRGDATAAQQRIREALDLKPVLVSRQ